MSSLARRGVRVALTLAGVAALSAAVTGTASAAPDVAPDPSIDVAPDPADQVDATAIRILDTDLPLGAGPALPAAFAVELP